MSSHRKRKYRVESSHNWDNSASRERDPSPEPLTGLFIQAYEADIIRGPSATNAAASLEVFEYDHLKPLTTNLPSKKIGDALIKWGGNQLGTRPDFPGDEDLEIGEKKLEDNNVVWVDRYDARLLLDALPGFPAAHTSDPDSPGGWSDLPSDTEDTFFFSPEETEDFRKDKRRRIIDQNREERLKARRAEDGETDEEEEQWGGSDEEPNDTQRELMRRTAAHLSSSPNPAQLEMRILANHGGDKRFAFLRGRWSHAWRVIKGKARIEKQIEIEAEKARGLGVLAGYGDSDGDSDGSDKGVTDPSIQGDTLTSPRPDADVLKKAEATTIAQEARRARAKEWAEKRRTSKDVSG